jgi:hypothetical protein
MAQLYPQALDSLFFASYYLQGYSGGIQTCLHVWGAELSQSQGQSQSYFRLALYRQSVVLVSSPLGLMTRDFFLTELLWS